jgi:Sec-independent protein translocase protein TatA
MECAVAAIGLKEILVIGVVVILLFGTTILPRIARSGGKRLRDSKDVLIQSKIELEAGLRDEDPATVAAQQPQTAPRSVPMR